MIIYECEILTTNNGFEYTRHIVDVKSNYPLPYKSLLLSALCQVKTQFTTWKDFRILSEVNVDTREITIHDKN